MLQPRYKDIRKKNICGEAKISFKEAFSGTNKRIKPTFANFLKYAKARVSRECFGANKSPLKRLNFRFSEALSWYIFLFIQGSKGISGLLNKVPSRLEELECEFDRLSWTTNRHIQWKRFKALCRKYKVKLNG